MISVALAGVTTILALYGLVPADVDNPLATSLQLAEGATWPHAILGVGVAVFLVPSILATIGAITWRWYPLDRKALIEMNQKRDEIHAKKRAERLSENGLSKFVEK